MTARTGGNEELALPEIERRVANSIRFGSVLEVDHDKGLIRVESGELQTDWLPWAAGRAAAGKRTWSAPEVGEQVLLLAPAGDLRQAVAVPGMYQDAYGAPSSDGNVDKIEYGDGTVVQYDRGSSALEVNIGGGQTTITATPGAIVLHCGASTLTVAASGITLSAPVINLN